MTYECLMQNGAFVVAKLQSEVQSGLRKWSDHEKTAPQYTIIRPVEAAPASEDYQVLVGDQWVWASQIDGALIQDNGE